MANQANPTAAKPSLEVILPCRPMTRHPTKPASIVIAAAMSIWIASVVSR